MKNGTRHVFTNIKAFQDTFFEFYSLNTSEVRDYFIHQDIKNKVFDFLEEIEAKYKYEPYVKGEVTRIISCTYYTSNSKIDRYSEFIVKECTDIINELERYHNRPDGLFDIDSFLCQVFPIGHLPTLKAGLKGKKEVVYKIYDLFVDDEEITQKEPVYYGICFLSRSGHSTQFDDLDEVISLSIRSKLYNLIGDHANNFVIKDHAQSIV